MGQRGGIRGQGGGMKAVLLHANVCSGEKSSCCLPLNPSVHTHLLSLSTTSFGFWIAFEHTFSDHVCFKLVSSTFEDLWIYMTGGGLVRQGEAQSKVYLTDHVQVHLCSKCAECGACALDIEKLLQTLEIVPCSFQLRAWRAAK
jgi:hypothetical protein